MSCLCCVPIRDISHGVSRNPLVLLALALHPQSSQILHFLLFWKLPLAPSQSVYEDSRGLRRTSQLEHYLV